MKSIQNQVALVTGGASGIGRLIALAFAERGAKVAVWDVNEAALRKIEADAKEKGVSILGMRCDVSDKDDVYARAADLAAVLGPVDILVNNAGIVSGSKFLETSDEKILRSMNVNLLSNFWTDKAFLPSMIERNRGHLVTISSAAGII
ncbi:MAG: SDR family NAD(P)-dependent oxidoreductase, partial [Treponemataceae bacterium]